MKKFWRRVNRGILLGILLLAILVGFIVTKEVQFRMEASEIRERALATVEAMLSLNLSEESTALGDVRSAETRARETERMEAMLSTYWDADAESEYYLSAALVRSSYEAYLADPVSALFSEIDLSVSDREIGIRQNGTDYAVVTLEINNLSTRHQGDGDCIFFGDHFGASAEEMPALEYQGSYYGYVEMEMHRTGGIWRACGMSATLYMTNKTVVETETGGES